MGQTVKARSPITLRQKKYVARNAAHKKARKIAAQKGAAKAHHNQNQTVSKKLLLKEQIIDLSALQKKNTQKTKSSKIQAPSKPPDRKSALNKSKDKAAKKKASKASHKKAKNPKHSAKKIVSKAKSPKKIADKNAKTSRQKKSKKSDQTLNGCDNIPFIFQHKADNILYYTQSSEELYLIEDDSADKSNTPITPKSFAPLPAVREPLSEYIMLRKQRDKQETASHNKSNSSKNAGDYNTPLAPTAVHIENIAKVETPLPRANSLALTNQGGLHALAFWLRTSRYKLIHMFRRNKKEKEAQKKRSKADILNEIAGLRAENAILRKRLGKSVMPNGRTTFEKA